MSEVTPARGPQLLFPWLAEPFAQMFSAWQGHALLLAGPAGTGQFELGLALASAQLCDTPLAQRPGSLACGHCASCHMLAAKTHPDLRVLVPPSMAELWSVDDSASAQTAEGGKAKPSLEIKVDVIRACIDFAQQTTARGADKIILTYPAESMNMIAANTLLKTLEEPPGRTRFILVSAHPDALLPTVRSRCQLAPLGLPEPHLALAWLQAQGVEQAEIVLAAAGGRPLLALERHAGGWDAKSWVQWPKALLQGQNQAWVNWPLPWVIEALGKLCHDVACVSVQAPPRFFPLESLPTGVDLRALGRWNLELQRHARQSSHPLNKTLQLTALIEGSRLVLARAKFTRTAQPKTSTSS